MPDSTRAMMRSTRLLLGSQPEDRAVEKLLETADLAGRWRRLEARLRLGLEVQYMLAQGRRRRDAEDEVETIRPTPIENLGTAIMAVAAQWRRCASTGLDLDFRPVGAGFSSPRKAVVGFQV